VTEEGYKKAIEQATSQLQSQVETVRAETNASNAQTDVRSRAQAVKSSYAGKDSQAEVNSAVDEYKLYQKDKAGNIIQPPTLSTGKPKLKTVMDGLASDPDKWKDIGNAAAEDAIKKKTFPAAGGEFTGVGNGTPIRGYYRGDKVDSFFPDF